MRERNFRYGYCKDDFFFCGGAVGTVNFIFRTKRDLMFQNKVTSVTLRFRRFLKIFVALYNENDPINVNMNPC